MILLRAWLALNTLPFASYCVSSLQDSRRTQVHIGRYAHISYACNDIWFTVEMSDALELMFVGIGVTTLCVAILVYTRINARRETYKQELAENGITYSVKQLRAMEDRAPDFRYTL